MSKCRTLRNNRQPIRKNEISLDFLAKWCHIIIITMSIMLCGVSGAFAPNLRYKRAVKRPLYTINRISDVTASCDTKNLNITVSMEQPFKGLLFAKDFSQECRSLGSLSYSVSVHLPTSGCGVRLSSDLESEEDSMYYTVSIVVQQDRHLHQITDQERIVQCYIEGDQLALKSDAVKSVVEDEIMRKTKKDHRAGRMKDEGWTKEIPDEESLDKGKEQLEEAMSAARAWMEIIPEDEREPRGTLQVGEPTLLMVKSTLPAGVGWKIVECVAHDGLGESSQKLLDESGCPVDELLLPAPLKGVPRPIAMMRHQEAVAKFAAFKFPDRDRLHLSCGLQLCRGTCQKSDCSNETEGESKEASRLARTLSKGEQGEILDRIEVYNSVEVIAPGIELDDLREVAERVRSNDASLAPFSNIPGDRTFCVSPDKMALTFCALGIIFLCAVVVAAGALFRARRTGVPVPYYPRSLFSSSTSGSAYGGSKLLLHDSPCMGQSTSRGMPYGRIL